jgi:hypothetical protein
MRWSAGHQASWQDSDRRSRGLLSFLHAGPYEPLAAPDQVTAEPCALCGAGPGQPCDTSGMRPALAGLALRGFSRIHLRRYLDLTHDPR